MTGRDAVRKLRNIGFKNTVLGVTGNVLEEDLKDFRSNGAGNKLIVWLAPLSSLHSDDILLKPMTILKFQEAIRKIEQSRKA